jgi:hypothetical protein
MQQCQRLRFETVIKSRRFQFIHSHMPVFRTRLLSRSGAIRARHENDTRVVTGGNYSWGKLVPCWIPPLPSSKYCKRVSKATHCGIVFHGVQNVCKFACDTVPFIFACHYCGIAFPALSLLETPLYPHVLVACWVKIHVKQTGVCGLACRSQATARKVNVLWSTLIVNAGAPAPKTPTLSKNRLSIFLPTHFCSIYGRALGRALDEGTIFVREVKSRFFEGQTLHPLRYVFLKWLACAWLQRNMYKHKNA